MSTSADSAQSWLSDKKPTAPDVQAVLTKLEARIEEWSGAEDKIQGSIEAALILQTYIDAGADASLPSQGTANLDNSMLIPHGEPIELENSIKQQTFAALKAQLGKTL
ncbi:hypothetical protein [Reinekea forsetii]|jgi:hypothetical protein|uniref:hypothetical protein n=1 Tax=Reinekea forsetii TaxID=1336806 RepID=UPI000C225C5D|nr:hypothetical protein [Reinekea forsetii]